MCGGLGCLVLTLALKLVLVTPEHTLSLLLFGVLRSLSLILDGFQEERAESTLVVQVRPIVLLVSTGRTELVADFWLHSLGLALLVGPHGGYVLT